MALVSKKPGKTRELYFYKFVNNFGIVLVDCPGYGFALGNNYEIDGWQKMMEIYIKGSPFLQRVLILVDAEKGLKEQDLGVYFFLNFF